MVSTTCVNTKSGHENAGIKKTGGKCSRTNTYKKRKIGLVLADYFIQNKAAELESSARTFVLSVQIKS